MNPFELHPEDREKMKNRLKKNKIEIIKLKEIISNYRKEFSKSTVPLWGYNNIHINKIFDNIIKRVEKETEDDS